MQKWISLLALAFLFAFVSCDKDDQPDQVPDCILSKTDIFKQQQANCDSASVIEYNFQGKTVYVFTDGICIADGAAFVLDTQCDTICVLNGLAGFTECEGVKFYDVATETRVLWQN